MSIRDLILDVKDDLKRKEITAWGQKVWAWELTGHERDTFEAGRVTSKGRKAVLDFKGSRAKLVVASLRVSGDANAALVFESGDVHRLQRKGGVELDRVYSECAIISGIAAGEDEEEEPRPFEQQNCSSSASPAISNGSLSPGAPSA